MKARLFTDGGARDNPGPAGIGYVLSFDDGREIAEGEYIGEATNNQAEYKALIAGLKLAQAQGVSELECFLDSELVVKQMRGEYKVKDVGLKVLQAEAKELAGNFTAVAFSHVPREKNSQADGLVNEALDKTTDS